jgi:tryptophan synthase alpha chain
MLSQVERKALIAFITAGDPHPKFTVPLMHAIVQAGVDIIELGIPFSDPMADGAVIQRANERALAHHITLRTVLAMVAEFRQQDNTTPLVLMGYLNPIEIMGYETFADKAKQAGIDGVLTVDFPPEEAKDYAILLKTQAIDPIFLLAPNSNEARVKKMNAMGSGYLYYVSLKGVTGAGHLDINNVKNKLAKIKKHTTLPVGVGFGVKDAQTAKNIAQVADGVVVGSALISKIATHLDYPRKAQQEIIELLKSMRQAMDS